MCDAVNSTWEEDKCAELIAQIKRSPYARDCFENARWFHKHDGYAMVVALQIAWNYWK